MDTSEYLPMFLAECRENLQELNLAVVRLEEAPDDRETVDAIFRIAHSLKGMAATMGFEGMATLTHKMEDVLELLRQRGGKLSREVVDVLLACLDALSGAVDAIDTDGAENLDPAELVERLQSLVREKDDPEHVEEVAEEAPAGGRGPVLAPITEGQTVLEVAAVLAEDAQMPAVRAFQVLAAAGEHGEVLRSRPAEGEVDGFDGRLVELLLATENEVDDIAAAIRAVPDVGDVRVAEHTPEPVAEAAPLAAVDESGAPEAAAPTASTPAAHKKGGHQTVRVDADRLDQLMHLMGELVVQRTHVEALSAEADVPGLSQAMQELTRSSHALQAMVMQIRMIPIEAVFMRFPRLVRDVASKLDKQVELDLVGKETELDRTVVDAIGDPLVHLIRNSLDHGLESPEDRVAAGKAPTGKLTIAARHAGGSIIITVKDDGHGINPAKVAAVAVDRGLITREQAQLIDMRGAIELLFAPGFSTAAEVGALSGRGVGMDAVREKIRELGGEVTVTSVQGEGTVNEIRLPLTLAIMSALLVEAGDKPFGIPLQRVERTMRLDDNPVRSVAGRKMLVLKDEALPLRRAVDVFGGAAAGAADLQDTHVVIVRGQEGSIALSVSKLIGQRELVTRPLPQNVAQEAAVSGAAVLSNGDIVLLADCDALTLNTHPALSASDRPVAVPAAV
ncbi:MAG TPA: chemotaxis protein CheA [Baekduia sp.]|uniref:chemotaxis protein CheA n=1 Tax=Baekduia sp. TaxID=2600305 RepID=UPI002D77196D|nr:chemotaxis protein CheA [Baekduia sp.]HET6508872.1 chemotaxis protein CheA [Baekduia sp.]